ncbi:MAG: hypothetical protein K2P66_11995, partial [Lachnospiraceae bacterium]|nr:hypothetical protein [Lachnospiraceae bacterium]
NAPFIAVILPEKSSIYANYAGGKVEFIMNGISGVHGIVMTQAIAEILTLSLAFCVFVRKKNRMTKEVVEKLEDGWQI